MSKKKIKTKLAKKKKKKISKKKYSVKKKRSAKKKKKRPYKIAKKLSMDEIYRIINKVQIGGKKAQFAVSTANAVIVENVIKDLNLKFNRVNLKTKVSFVIHPSERFEEEVVFDLDFLEDEILEDGQLF